MLHRERTRTSRTEQLLRTAIKQGEINAAHAAVHYARMHQHRLAMETAVGYLRAGNAALALAKLEKALETL
jgi:hypothetical protein